MNENSQKKIVKAQNDKEILKNLILKEKAFMKEYRTLNYKLVMLSFFKQSLKYLYD